MQRHSLPGRNLFSGAREVLLGALLLAPASLLAQQPAGAGTRTTTLPDSPQPKQQPAASPNGSKGNKFIGYMTNRSIVFPDIATSDRPLTAGGKFKLFIDQSISPAYIAVGVVDAAFGQARDVPKGYGQGWDAYADRFGAVMARASSNSFFTTFAFASAFHQDPRFFPQSHPTFWGSIKYSAKRLAVTRTDSGLDTINSSGIIGTMASETLANAYLPKDEQNGRKTAERFGTDLAWKFAANMFKNYWPTVFVGAGLNRLKVIPDPGPPDAQTPR